VIKEFAQYTEREESAVNSLNQYRIVHILLFFVLWFAFSAAPVTAQAPYISQFLRGYNVAVSGITQDADGNVFAAAGSSVAKMGPDLQVVYQRAIPADVGLIIALAVDSSGDAYLTGNTTKIWQMVIGELVQPAILGCDSPNGCNGNAFVAKMDGRTGDLLWITYFGGRAADSGSSIAVAADGTIYVAGTTSSTDFPISEGAFVQTSAAPEGFLARFAVDGKSLISSTYFHGAPRSIALDGSGAVYVTGRSAATIPGTEGAFQSASGYWNLMASLDEGETWSNLTVPSRALRIEPDGMNPGLLYAATLAGLFRSDDGGVNWAEMEGQFQTIRVADVRVDPSDSKTIYVVADTDGFQMDLGWASNYALWKSTDGGGSWVKLRTVGTSNGLSINRTQPSTLYLDLGAGILVSADGGSTWSGLPVPNARGLAVDQSIGDVIYLGSSRDLHLARSVDAGQHWDYVLDPARNVGSNIGSTPLFANGPVLFHSSVAFTAALAGGYAANGVRRSKDGGQTWSDLPDVPATALHGDVNHPDRVFASGPAGLFVSLDSGDSWRSLRANMDNPNVSQIAASADGTLYAMAVPQPGAFVAKVDPDLSHLLFMTAYGDTAGITPYSIAVDADSRVVIAGTTTSRNMPRSEGQPGPGGYQDGFVARFDADGTQLEFARFLGGSGSDSVNIVTVSANGDIYLAGSTSSVDFPVTENALQSQSGAQVATGFISVLGLDGNLKYSTYFGGTEQDSINSILLAGDKLYFGGYFRSRDFPGRESSDAGDLPSAGVVRLDLTAAGVQ
jgi:photosystem II stability/assembly factor-like uncharacterized protein